MDCLVPRLVALWAKLPLLIGLNVGGRSQVVLGPAVTGFFDPYSGASTAMLSVSVGLYWRLLSWLRIAPEVALGYVLGALPVGPLGYENVYYVGQPGVLLQGGIAFVFGNRL